MRNNGANRVGNAGPDRRYCRPIIEENVMSDQKEHLQKRRDELYERLQAISRDLSRGLEKDYEEQSIQLENLEVLQEIARVTREELQKVELELADLKRS